MNRAGKNNKILLVTALVFYMLVLIRDAGILYISPYEYICFCLISFLFLPASGVASLLMFILPFSGGLNFHTITGLAFAAVMLKTMKRGTIRIRMVGYLLFSFFMGAFDLLSGNVYETARTVILIVVYLGLMSYLICYSEELDIVPALKYFVYGTLLSFVNVIYIFASTYSLTYIVTYGIRFGTTREGILQTSYDPNTMGLFAATSVALIYLLNKSGNNGSLQAAVTAAAISLMGSMSISRTYLLVMLLLILYILFRNIGNKKIPLAAAAIIAVMYLIMLSGKIKIFDYVVKRYIKRFTGDSSFGGRKNIFMQYTLLYLSDARLFLLGHGLDGYRSLGLPSAHNGLQEIFLAWGICGFILIFIWICSLIIKAGKMRDRQLGPDLYIPFIVFILYIQTLQWFSIYTYILLSAVMLLAVRVRKVSHVQN